MHGSATVVEQQPGPPGTLCPDGCPALCVPDNRGMELAELSRDEVAALTWSWDPGSPLIGPPFPSPVLADPTFLPPDATPDGRWHLWAHSLLGVHHHTSDDGLRLEARGDRRPQRAAGPDRGPRRRNHPALPVAVRTHPRVHPVRGSVAVVDRVPGFRRPSAVVRSRRAPAPDAAVAPGRQAGRGRVQPGPRGAARLPMAAVLQRGTGARPGLWVQRAGVRRRGRGPSARRTLRGAP